MPAALATGKDNTRLHASKNTIIVKTAISSNSISSDWKDALKSRMSRERIDSFGNIKRALTGDEVAWKKLVESKAAAWNEFRDSLAFPFNDIVLEDTIFVMLGFLGVDDGFTYRNRTVCLDVTALFRAYGKADLPENYERIDRLFAHEYTHLLHKEWAKRKSYIPLTFKDSILWECIYEGIGMYRSLNPKWLPTGGKLPAITITTLEKLYPIFVERLNTIFKSQNLTNPEKEQLNANLSRGNVNQKWGAFPVAVWLALETEENEKKLPYWIDKGPESVIELAGKYLEGDLKKVFDSVYGK